MKKRYEYTDEDHDVMMEYYEIMDSKLSDAKLLAKMNHLISQDPYFFDPYLTAYDVYLKKGKVQEANTLLDAGYKLALKIVVDKKGNFPDSLEWGWLENRHIIRIILTKGIALWQSGDTKTSLTIFRNLLNSNPFDNVGVRYYMLAVLEELSYDTYTSLYENDDYLSDDIFTWFEKGRKKYTDEFKVLESFE